MTTLTVGLGADSYPVYIGNGLLEEAGMRFSLSRKVLIVTDDGVPAAYAKTLAAQCREPYLAVIGQGEGSKTLAGVEALCRTMMENRFTRNDAVAAVGGGVVGDLAGFAAASYMRGIDFYNIPTTVLAQIDSSVGGKTGVNLDHIKNIVGAFKQPRGVIADPALLATLPARQKANGLAEAVKMALTFDADLFERFERITPGTMPEDVIPRSLALKIAVVEQDEKEVGLRRVLNFGHTLGHGIESLGLGYYHGECVALGMPAMCSPAVRERLIPVLRKLGLPTGAVFDREAALGAVMHDKKAGDGFVNAVFVDVPGTWRTERLTEEMLRRRLAAIPTE